MKLTFNFVKGYLTKLKGRIVLAIVLSLVSSILIIVRPRIIGEIVDSVITPIAKLMSENQQIPDNLLTVLAILLGAILVLTVVREFSHFFYRINIEIISQNVLRTIKQDLYVKLSTLDFDFFDNNRTGDIMTKMTSDTDNIRHLLAFTLFMLFENATICIGAIIAMFLINPLLAVCMVAMVPFVLVLSTKMSRRMLPLYHKVREAFSKLNSYVQENIGGNRVVKAFAKEDYETERFSKFNESYAQANYTVAEVQSKFIPTLEFFAGMLSVILICVGGILAIYDMVSIGDIVTFNGLLWALNYPLRRFPWLTNELQRAIASTVRIKEMLDTQPKIDPEETIDKEAPARFMGEIEFKNVCFKYDNDPVLTDISFKVLPGQTVAIIGPTGSGKSTLINLLSRFYDVSSGEVLIDGKNVKEYNLTTLRDNIAVAMQDIFLFSDTIEGNIAYGNPNASFDKIKYVSRAADAHNFISKMPDGYDTIVGERGVGLSGGQKQRIALARALLKDPSILILDDTTSAVDMETEHYIQNTLKEFFADRTTFIIAHRISSVKNADLILVLSDGQLIEYGTHNNLINRPVEEAYYRSVFENQMGDFDSFYLKGGNDYGTK